MRAKSAPSQPEPVRRDRAALVRPRSRAPAYARDACALFRNRPPGLTDKRHRRRGPSPVHQVLIMNPKYYYHTPIKPASTRASCPVCHETVYSRAGIHPQCAVIQSDPPKPRPKKPLVGALLDPVVNATDPAGADVVVDPAIVKLAAAVERPVVASHGGWRSRR
jgi:hypothetical protein